MHLFFSIVILQSNPVELFIILYPKAVRAFVNMAKTTNSSFARIQETKVEYEGYHFHFDKSYADMM